MNRLPVIGFLLLSLFPCGAEERPLPSPPPVVFQLPQAWLGLHVVKPDQTTIAHLPSLPPGVGFVVDHVDENGPAASAGLEKYDVLWKFRDQLLVNEAQLATLLRLTKPGEEVELSAFRKGEAVTVSLVLGNAPEDGKGRLSNMADLVMLPEEAGPMRVVNMASRQAVFSTEEGRAIVRREGEKYHVTIHGPGNEVVFEKSFDKGSEFSSVPRDWRKRVCALQRGLDHALEGRTVPPVRSPRPRVVPPANP